MPKKVFLAMMPKNTVNSFILTWFLRTQSSLTKVQMLEQKGKEMCEHLLNVTQSFLMKNQSLQNDDSGFPVPNLVKERN